MSKSKFNPNAQEFKFTPSPPSKFNPNAQEFKFTPSPPSGFNAYAQEFSPYAQEFNPYTEEFTPSSPYEFSPYTEEFTPSSPSMPYIQQANIPITYKEMVNADISEEGLSCSANPPIPVLEQNQIIIYTYNVGVDPNDPNIEPLTMETILNNLQLKSNYICLFQEVSAATNAEFMNKMSDYYMSRPQGFFSATPPVPDNRVFNSILISPEFAFERDNNNQIIMLNSSVNRQSKVRSSGLVKIKHNATGISFATVSIHRPIADNPIQINDPIINDEKKMPITTPVTYSELNVYMQDFKTYKDTNIILGGDFNMNLFHFEKIVDVTKSQYKHLVDNKIVPNSVSSYMSMQLMSSLNTNSKQYKDILNTLNESIINTSYPRIFSTTSDEKGIYSKYLDFVLSDGPNFVNPNNKVTVGRICTQSPSDHHIIYRVIELTDKSSSKVVGSSMNLFVRFILG